MGCSHVLGKKTSLYETDVNLAPEFLQAILFLCQKAINIKTYVAWLNWNLKLPTGNATKHDNEIILPRCTIGRASSFTRNYCSFLLECFYMKRSIRKWLANNDCALSKSWHFVGRKKLSVIDILLVDEVRNTTARYLNTYQSQSSAQLC